MQEQAPFVLSVHMCACPLAVARACRPRGAACDEGAPPGVVDPHPRGADDGVMTSRERPFRDGHPTVPLSPRGESQPIARMVAPTTTRATLRDAVLMLAAKLEAHGVDCSDVTEMLGQGDG